jgi:hypothetical protein
MTYATSLQSDNDRIVSALHIVGGKMKYYQSGIKCALAVFMALAFSGCGETESEKFARERKERFQQAVPDINMAFRSLEVGDNPIGVQQVLGVEIKESGDVELIINRHFDTFTVSLFRAEFKKVNSTTLQIKCSSCIRVKYEGQSETRRDELFGRATEQDIDKALEVFTKLKSS